MPFRLGTSELIIILVIVILLFGVGRIGQLGADLGQAIKSFRNAVSSDDDQEHNTQEG